MIPQTTTLFITTKAGKALGLVVGWTKLGYPCVVTVGVTRQACVYECKSDEVRYWLNEVEARAYMTR